MLSKLDIVNVVCGILLIVFGVLYIIELKLLSTILGLIGIVIGILLIQNIKPITKTGEVLTWKEFFKRWKQGMEGVTMFQQVKMQIQATWITIIGILCGITVCIFALKTLWWLLIILIGGLYNTSIQMLSLIQRKNQLKQFEDLQRIAISDLQEKEKEVIKNV